MFRDTSDYDDLFGGPFRPGHRGGVLMGAATDTAATLGYLSRALKAPTIGRVWEQLATTARAEGGWSHEEYLTAVLQRQVADREANGTALRIGGGALPCSEDPRGLQRRPPALAAPRRPRAPGDDDLDPESGERDPPRSSRGGRQDPPRDRAGGTRPPTPATRCCSTPPPAGCHACRPRTRAGGSSRS